MADYFYMRISTKEERELQKYTRQESALKRYAEENNLQFDEHTIYKEDRSGKNFTDRSEWNKLEKILRSGDTVVFKDISRFTREAENGYKKYMKLMDDGVNLVFLDNKTISTDYIKQLLDIAEKQNLIAKISLENTVKLILYVELDRAEQERVSLSIRVTDGIAAAKEKNGGRPISGRKKGTMEKLTPELEAAITVYLQDRTVMQVDIMRKYNISRNTLKKYAKYIGERLKTQVT